MKYLCDYCGGFEGADKPNSLTIKQHTDFLLTAKEAPERSAFETHICVWCFKKVLAEVLKK